MKEEEEVEVEMPERRGSTRRRRIGVAAAFATENEPMSS